MKTKRLISLLLSVILLAGVVTIPMSVSAAESDTQASGAGNYYNGSYLEGNAYNGTDLGCTYTSASTKWKVWAPTATKVELKLYKTGSDTESGAGNLGSEKMTKDGNCWTIQLSGDYKNVYYTYAVTVNGVTNETQDVYSKATGVNGNRSMVVDLDSTDPAGWENDKHVLFDSFSEAAVWEVHVRDFTIAKNSGVSEGNKGKYLGFTEGGSKLNGVSTEISTGIDYLVEQGINCVQLLPVYDYQSVNEAKSSEWGTHNRNWGYDPINYNVPEGSYSTNPYDGNVRITEFKQMIQALHDRGISVIMDVVYNHTFVTGDSCFERTVPGYYFRKTSATTFSNGSGCGNETASDKAMFRKYMIDSVKYWVEEYHIDGFRFDLMGIHDITTMNQIRAAVDAIYPDGSGKKIIMYGEPWTGGTVAITDGCSQSKASQLSDRVGMFCDSYRDAIKGGTNDASKGYIQGDTTKTAAVANGLKAAGFSARSPQQYISYADCHDNLGLWDKIIISNGSTQYNSTSEVHKSQLRLAAGLLFTSQGVVFQLAGTEHARTKQGDHNSYASSDAINEHDWSRVKTYATEVAYFKGLREIRAAYSPFTDSTFASRNTISFSSQSGTLIAYTINNVTANASKEWGKVAVLLNNGSSAVTANLGSSGWVVVADGTKAGLKKLNTVSGSSYSVPARSSVILVESATFDRLNVAERKFGYLTTEHCKEDGTLIKSSTAKYEVGDTFRAIPDKDLLFDNEISKTEGTVSGTVTEGMNAKVKFYYKSTNIKSGYLTVNYVKADGTKVDDDTVLRLRQGETYQILPVNVQGYQMDTTKYPTDTFGTFDGNDKTIKFTYKDLPTTQTIVHYYNANGWIPVRCYSYTDDGQNPTGLWTQATRMTADPALGDKWYSITINVPSCYVMFHNGGGSQEPSQGDSGYKASGEVWIKDKVVTFNATIITSHIDVKTGKQLSADEVVNKTQVKSSDTYTTSAKSGFGQYITPINATGTYAAGVTNVVYLYNAETIPTESTGPTETTGSTIPTDTTESTGPSDTTGPTESTGPTTPSDTVLLGDANQDGSIDIKDATLVQKYAAELAVLVGKQLIAADVNEDGDINVKDVTIIQKYCADLETQTRIGQIITIGGSTEPTESTPPTQPTTDSTEPTTQPTTVTDPVTEPTVTEEPSTDATQPTVTDPVEEPKEFIFSNNKGWSTVYAYYWNSATEEKGAEWPGIEMTFVGYNDIAGEPQYAITVPAGYDMIIFSSGTSVSGEQSADTVIDRSVTGYYPTDERIPVYNSWVLATW